MGMIFNATFSVLKKLSVLKQRHFLRLMVVSSLAYFGTVQSAQACFFPGDQGPNYCATCCGVCCKVTCGITRPCGGPSPTPVPSCGQNSFSYQTACFDTPPWGLDITGTQPICTQSCGINDITGTFNCSCPPLAERDENPNHAWSYMDASMRAQCTACGGTPTPTPTPVPCGQTNFSYTATCPESAPWPVSVGTSCYSDTSCSMGAATTTLACNCPPVSERDENPAHKWHYMDTDMRAQCLLCGGSGPTPTPTTPTPAPGCNYDKGGIGRVCTTNSDCCSGHCEVAGDQPFMSKRDCAAGDSSCIIGPNFLSGFSGGGKDSYVAGGVTPSGGSPKTAPGKVCVPSALPATYLDTVGLPAAVPALNVNKKLIMNDGSYLKCYLEGNDVHRNGTGCSCTTGYEAVVLSTADYATYNVAARSTRLEVMWAQIVDMLKRHPQIARTAATRINDLIPDAGACTVPGPTTGPFLDCPPNHGTTASVSGCCCFQWIAGGYVSRNACVCDGYPNSSSCIKDPTPTPTPTPGGTTSGGTTTGGTTTGGTISDVYTDEASPQWRMTAPQNYGVNTPNSPDASASDLVTRGAGYVLGCVKKCDSTTTGYHDPLHPLKCLCPDNGSVWSQADYKCKTCDYEGQIADANGNCDCPIGYSLVTTAGGPKKCRPDMYPEYFRNIDGYPVCGPQRIPMLYDLTAKNISSNGTPKISEQITVNNVNFKFAEKITTADSEYPRYYYSQLPHCGCGDTVFETPDADVVPSNVPFATGADFASVLRLRDASGRPKQPYGAIAIPKDNSGQIDGRLGTVYPTNAQCACPNINEKMVPNGKGGVTCMPEVDTTDPNIRFASFDRVRDDVDGVVMHRGASNQVLAGDGKIVSKVLLHESPSSTAATTVYNRGIWRCDVGYQLNSSGQCIFDKSKHMCSTGSEVSSSVGGGFDNVVNKKLACCMNSFGSMGDTGTSTVRFDCIENVKDKYSDFNALWASSDTADNGGQMNALMLADASGKPVTGFYTENGVRCAEYSEFSGSPIQPGVVNPVLNTGQMVRASGNAKSDTVELKGSALQNPSGIGFDTMVKKLGSRAKIPTTAAERRRCPILVRAAMVAVCPQNPQVANSAIKTFEDKTTSPSTRRCAAASSIQVKVRVEQITEIASQPKMSTIDTVIDSQNASAISIDRIIQKKYGNSCPKGTTRQGDACVY